MGSGSTERGEPVRPLDPVTRAAIALHRRPGGYVVLLGAGISKPTGVKSAWEILEVLLGQVAAAEGVAPDDSVEWWRHRRGIEASYSDVLGTLASTQEERRALLAPFFERTADDLDTGAKLPSDAHRELARLVKRGFVRIIVTLNFDHLMEQALRDEGIEPTFVSGPAAIDAMEPLHAQRSVVVHIHGDYLSPELLNTAGELASYKEPVKRLIRQVADEYGTIVVGWSAAWDTGLVELLTPVAKPRFASWWIQPGGLNPIQTGLSLSRRAEVIELTADDALLRLGVALDAVVEDAERDQPLDISVGVATMKRELRTGVLGVRSHDLVRKALGDVGESAVIRPTDYPTAGPPDFIATQTEAVLGVLRASAAYVATLAYWGDERTDRWWFDDLERLGWRPHESGLSELIKLTRSPSVVLCYSAGAAAVAAERWDLVPRLLTEPTAENSTGSGRGQLVATLTPGSCGIAGGSTRLCSFVAGTLHRYLGLGVGLAIDAWERFEYLCALSSMSGPNLPWRPCMRAEGIGAAENKATPALWLDGHLNVIQPFLSAPGWFDGGEVTTRRGAFDAAFTKYVSDRDFALLPSGGGAVPSGRHYPGRYDDRPDIDS